MPQDDTGNSEDDLPERLHGIVDRMLAPFGKSSPRQGSLLLDSYPFDISKPNEHDSKADFVQEREAVRGSIEHLDAILGLLGGQSDDEASTTMRNRLAPILDQKLFRNAKSERASDTYDLVRKNVAEIGGYTTTILILLDFWMALSERASELADQEEKFWSLGHRAPNYYARTIAKRLARLYGRETGQKPTYGSSATGGSPSTSYSRALEEVFAELGIEQKIRTHAEWAIAQIGEDDLKPVPVNSLASMMGLPQTRPPPDGLLKIAQALIDKRPAD